MELGLLYAITLYVVILRHRSANKILHLTSVIELCQISCLEDNSANLRSASALHLSNLNFSAHGNLFNICSFNSFLQYPPSCAFVDNLVLEFVGI